MLSMFARVGRIGGSRGNVTVTFALLLPMVIGGAGLGVETGYWYYQQLKLQQTADAAAYGASVEQRSGGSTNTVNSAAKTEAQRNGYNAATDTLQVNSPPTSGPNQNATSVEVIMTRAAPRFFSALFASGPVMVRARAVSTYSTAAGACVLALDTSASAAVQFAGSSSLTLTGCDVMSNSLASDAVYAQGSAQLTTPCVMSAGGVNFNGSVTMTACSAAVTNLPPVADPFASIPEPADTGPCLNGNGSNLSPGRYCNGLTLSGTTNLSPGVYIISGGTLKTNANSVTNGSGVTFVLTNNAGVSFNGNATLNFSAPTSGTYAGILFFGSRSNTSGAITLNGTATSQMTGDIYFPKQAVSYLGNFSGANGCTQVVADTVQWSGSTSMNVNCSAYGMQQIPIAAVVKLAE